MRRILELENDGGVYKPVETQQTGVTNFMSWDRLARESLDSCYPRENITGITVSDRGLEIRLEPKPVVKKPE